MNTHSQPTLNRFVLFLFQDSLEDLKKPWGKGSWVTDGYCNCNQCEKSNVSLVVDVTVSALQCPKDTRYCFQVQNHHGVCF
jgi:hypothetical protein